MRAVVCRSLTGEDGLEVVDDWPAPGECGRHQVRISVRAASVNFPDTLLTRGTYQIRREPPFVPGCEAAGVISEVGPDVHGLTVGDRVLALTGSGAFAEELVVDPATQQVHVLPDEMPFDHGAAFNLTYGTSGHALAQRSGLVAGETVLVTGAAGGCGSAAVQIAVAIGARVVAVVGGPLKAALATQLGAHHVIDHHELDGDRALSARVAELTDGRGVDVVCDNVGSDVRDLLRCLAWNGRFLVVGFAGGDVPTVGLNLTILKSVSIIGIAYGASAIVDPPSNRALFAQLFDWYRAGKVTPHVGARFALTDAVAAVRLVHDRAALGKIVIEL